MNRDRAKELLPIIEAFANGEDIERWDILNNWNDTDDITCKGEYRIKPKPREGYVLEENIHPKGMFCEGGNCIKVREVL